MNIINIFIFYLLGLYICLKLPSILIFGCHFMEFAFWKARDMKETIHRIKTGKKLFRPFGLKMFCGRQGSGKTIGMVWYLEKLRKKYPKAMIYTNFSYDYQTAPLTNLNDLLIYRNGDDGVIFAIDELQNEFSSNASKDFPESLLGEITMQRKQKIVILATSQVFTRISKPLREQCYEVIDCGTFFGRWTRLRCYDAFDFCVYADSMDPEKRFKVPKKWKQSFIQTDVLRGLYDTYEKVQRLSRQGFSTKRIEK